MKITFICAVFPPEPAPAGVMAHQLAADMGGAGYIFTCENDAHIMHNSAMINLHMADFAVKRRTKKGVLLVLGVHISRLQSGESGESEKQRIRSVNGTTK